ncbi:hypothetical protein C0J52_14062 [Blattella germanica]|nr:hypothetical protein C0J52_14062 [Blattella germanica]
MEQDVSKITDIIPQPYFLVCVFFALFIFFSLQTAPLSPLGPNILGAVSFLGQGQQILVRYSLNEFLRKNKETHQRVRGIEWMKYITIGV